MNTPPTAHDLAILGRMLAEGFPALTDDQRAALEAFTQANGPTWRDKLADMWLGATEPMKHKAALRQVRNTYGPTWLFEVYAHGWRPDVPAWTGMAEAKSEGEAPYRVKWSADFEPPAVGDVVRVRINGLGLATVTGYFVEGGWLGVTVFLHEPKDWYVKQNGGNVVGHSFGAEIELVAPAIEPHPLADSFGYRVEFHRAESISRFFYVRPDNTADSEGFHTEAEAWEAAESDAALWDQDHGDGIRALAALRAIVARIQGEFDQPDLVAFGPLSTDVLADVLAIAQGER